MIIKKSLFPSGKYHPKVNGDISDEERKHLELEYIATTKGNGHGVLSNSENRKVASAIQSNGSGVVKVAMFGEFEVPAAEVGVPLDKCNM